MPVFVKKAQHWHALKEQKQEKMDELALSLRTFLFRSMLDALLQWLQDTIKDPEQLKTAMTLQVFLPKEEASELMIPFLQFDQETKTLAVQGPCCPLGLHHDCEAPGCASVSLPS